MMSRGAARWWLGIGVFLFLALRGILPGPPAAADSRMGREYAVKLAYLYNLIRFTRWPAGLEGASVPEGDGFLLGIVGDDPFGPLLQDLEDRTVHGVPIRVVRIRTPDQLRRCRAVFVAESAWPRLGAVLQTVRGRPVLTFSDVPGFVDRGGMVGFVLRENRVRFEVNLVALRQAGLHMSSEVLRLAARVIGGPEGEIRQ